MLPPLPAEYLATTYRVFTPAGPVDLRIGQFSPDFDAYLASHGHRSWAFITAWNPAGRPLSPADNAARNAQLRDALAGYGVLPACGRADTGDHYEDSFCAFDLPTPQAVELARRFGQNAIVAGHTGQPPHLVDTR